MGTQFTIFDKGLGPQKPGSLSDGSNIREELAAVLYVRILYFHICDVIFTLKERFRSAVGF